MEEIVLEGVEAVKALQCYTMLNAVNNILTTNMMTTIEKGYTEDVAKNMSKDMFISMALITELQNMSEQCEKSFKELTGLDANMFKISITNTPKILIKKYDEKVEEKEC